MDIASIKRARPSAASKKECFREIGSKASLHYYIRHRRDCEGATPWELFANLVYERLLT